MSIITSGGGIDRTHPAESPEDAAMLAAGRASGWQQAAVDALNQPATMTPKAKAAFETAEKALTTSFLDPMVSNRDTKSVLDALDGLASREWLAVVRKLRETKAPEGTLFERFAKRGLADDSQAVERFLRQIVQKLGTRDQAGNVSIPADLVDAVAKEAGAPNVGELSSFGHARDTALFGAAVAVRLFAR